MKIFGKTLGEYVHFQRIILALILVVGLARLVLSLAGVPNDTVKWLSTTAVGVAGIFYYAIRVHTSGFGSYKQLLPLLVNQHVVAHGITIIGIIWAIATGQSNIFSAPEYSGGQEGSNWIHVVAHVGVGMIGFSLVGWLLGSGIMWVTKKVAPRGEGAAAARA
jgi:hypothetical protein